MTLPVSFICCVCFVALFLVFNVFLSVFVGKIDVRYVLGAKIHQNSVFVHDNISTHLFPRIRNY